MLLTSRRKKLEATARTLHLESLVDESVSFSDVEWMQQTSNWLKEAIRQAEKQLEESEQMSIRSDELLKRLDAIKAQIEALQKQGNGNVQVITIRIPLKAKKPCKKLVTAA